MIAFFGTGLLGSGFVRGLRRRGEAVQVWNRTPEKALALEAAGAKAFDEPADAARGASRVHLALSDDAAVDAVLERARPGIGAGTIVVDHTTTSAAGVKGRVARWDERGIRYLHAPVFMGPQNAIEGTGIMLVSGEAPRIADVRSALEDMTGKLVDVGERPDKAAAFKLLGNLFLMFFTGGLAEVFALARALDVEPEDAASLFLHFNPGNTLAARADRMLAGNFRQASWELGMARKDARLMEEAAARGGVPLDLLPTITARMDAMLARGHAHDDWTVIALDALAARGVKAPSK
jgi:3-hydroxyisobutyrate dehydrogenase